MNLLTSESNFSIKSSLETSGTVLLDYAQSTFTLQEWKDLEAAISPKKLPYEQVHFGDVGELEHLNVGRLITDIDQPRSVNRKASLKVISILNSEKMSNFYREITGLENIWIRRCQAHILQKGCFIGYHTDTDSNPDYLVAIILQFSSNYEGGNYIVYNKQGKRKAIKTHRFSMLINRCDLPHEVTQVDLGERKTLAYFLSPFPGINRRQYLKDINV